MYHYCKLCGECLLLEDIPSNDPNWNMLLCAKSYKCHACTEYSLSIFQEDNGVLYEGIQYRNLYIWFWPKNKTAYLRKRINKHDIETLVLIPFYEKELTHELAVQWVNKLKTYLVFQ